MKIESINPKVFLDIVIGGSQSGRVVIELFESEASKTVSNFIRLCSSDTELSYKGSVFHRVIKNFIIQGGCMDVSNKTTEDPNEGTAQGSRTTNGVKIEKENLGEMNEPFLVCMANDNGDRSNGTQFFITLGSQSHLNGKHTIFGKVIHGKSVVREIERVNTNDDNIPVSTELVKIADCGIWDFGMDIPIFNACYDTIGGDVYEEYPDDDDKIEKESSESACQASLKIKESGTLLFKRGNYEAALLKYRKCLRYIFEFIPDQEHDPKWFGEFIELKKKVYLNMTLSYLKLNDTENVVKYCSFLKEMDNLNTQEKAKNHYRIGVSYTKLKKYKEAIDELKEAISILPEDSAIQNELLKASKLLDEKKIKEKSSYAKFFS